MNPKFDFQDIGPVKLDPRPDDAFFDISSGDPIFSVDEKPELLNLVHLTSEMLQRVSPPEYD